jgi:hypothetical protein
MERERPTDNPRQPDIFARLEQAVGAIQDAESFRAYLEVQARFHHYSPNNIALILAQRPDATRVAGYQDWLRMQHYVRRGEKAIKIIVPFVRRVETEDSSAGERVVTFGTGSVFDISQTEGEPLPAMEVPTLVGEEGRELHQHLSTLAQREQLRVETVDRFPEPEQMGVYDPARREIRLKQAAPLQMVKTLAHELGHHFAAHAQTGPEAETVAEAVAYVVLAHYGLDSGERSFPYIATWAKDKKILQAAMGTIQKVSAKIISGVEQQSAADEGLPPIAGGAPQRTYRGYSEDDGSAIGPEAVFVAEENGFARRLRHEQRHSASFSWGYGGSGPADLARSILADHLGYLPSPAVYQVFKWEYVARWRQGQAWAITSTEIDRFLASPRVRDILIRDAAAEDPLDGATDAEGQGGDG